MADVPRKQIQRVEASPAESASIASLVDDARRSLQPSEFPDFTELAMLAHDLPEHLRRSLVEFRITGRPLGGFVISGLPIEESRLEPTPLTYADRARDDYTAWVDTLLLLLGSALGDPFSFATQQRGRLVLDVFPLRGHEDRQLGTSSDILLEWHVEDAFLDLRPDWILLLGMRNHDRTATTVGFAHDLNPTNGDRELLFAPRFVLLPDDSHTPQLNEEIAGADEGGHADTAFDEIADMALQPRKVPILSGDPSAPYIQIDPAFMEFDLGDPEAEGVLNRVVEDMHSCLQDVVLLPGDLLVLDNKRAVHGRRPFSARYDGTDRWLKRVLLTADLRRSAGMRSGPYERAVHVTSGASKMGSEF